MPRLLTLDVLNTEFLDETGRKDSTGECSSEDGGELGIETSNTHIFELEVWGEDRIGRTTDYQLVL
jgi:hypothetical protein